MSMGMGIGKWLGGWGVYETRICGRDVFMQG